MKLQLLPLVFLIGLLVSAQQVGIGTSTPEAGATLEIKSTDKGFLLPRMVTAERAAISNPAVGLTIFNTDTQCIEFYTPTGWQTPCLTEPDNPVSDCAGLIVTSPVGGGDIIDLPYISAAETAVVDTDPSVQTGRIWMDRNLGAARRGRAWNDCYAVGSLFQWGRDSEGHEWMKSEAYHVQGSDRFGSGNNNIYFIDYEPYPTTIAPNTGGAWDGKFIVPLPPYNVVGNFAESRRRENWFYDENVLQFGWNQNPSNATTMGVPATQTTVKGDNDPCPSGYRVPSLAEWQAELAAYPVTSTATDPTGIALHPQLFGVNLGVFRDVDLGGFTYLNAWDSRGESYYWTSTFDIYDMQAHAMRENSTREYTHHRTAVGANVRCIKE